MNNPSNRKPRGSRACRAALNDARRDALAQIRNERPLTPAEAAEQARLDHIFYMRIYRQHRAERFGHVDAHRRPRAPQGVRP